MSENRTAGQNPAARSSGMLHAESDQREQRHNQHAASHLTGYSGTAASLEQSDGSGTDSHALQIYSQLIEQTPPEDEAAIAQIGAQIRDYRYAMQASRRQLAALLHLEIELLVGLENGSGTLDMAQIVLEQVQALHAKHHEKSIVQ